MRYHLGISRRAAQKRAVELLGLVRIPEAQRRLGQYPHELSGGMRQRVMIAIAVCCNPKLLLADEPTTALDVTVQKQILDLLGSLQRELDMAMILITHDLGVVAGRAKRIGVMYAGRIVEEADTQALFADVRHPYTEGLMASIPRIQEASHTRLTGIGGRPPDMVDPPAGCRFAPALQVRPGPLRAGVAGPARCALRPRLRLLLSRRDTRMRRALRPSGLPTTTRIRHPDMAGTGTAHLRDGLTPLLRVEDLTVEFPAGHGRKVHAVSGISFDLVEGETLGLVGESGCGKSTTGRAVMQLPRPTSGSVRFDGAELTTMGDEDVRRTRRRCR